MGSHPVLGDHDDVGPREAVEYLLHSARRHLDMEAAFLAELTEQEQIYRATTGEDAESFTIHEGGALPRLEGYCRRVMETDAPWVIRDTQAEPAVRDLAITATGQFGSYIGVPVTFPDGRAFGTLCCVSHRPRPDLDDGHVAVMETLADVLGFHVGQLEERRGAIKELEEYAGNLAESLVEHELRLEVFRYLIDVNVDPMLLLQPDSLLIVYANRAAAELAGVERDAMHGRPPWRFHAGWSEDVLREHLADLAAPGAAATRYQMEPLGGLPPLDVQAQRIVSANGRAFILWTGHDATHHQEAEERLRRALAIEREATEQLRRLDRLRNAFLTAVSHELRTPLTTVKGAAETLRSGRLVDDRATSLMLDRLVTNADRLERLLTDLLDLNQFAHGTATLRRERVRLDELVRNAVEEVGDGDRLVVQHLEPVEADVAPVKVERIVANLVANALIHTPPGTPVEIRLSAENDGALLVVADHGPGIPEPDRHRIFQPFVQGATVPAHRPGTGIGLSLVAAFAQLHGGRVWVEDHEEGGTAFHVLLPTIATEQ